MACAFAKWTLLHATFKEVTQDLEPDADVDQQLSRLDTFQEIRCPNTYMRLESDTAVTQELHTPPPLSFHTHTQPLNQQRNKQTNTHTNTQTYKHTNTQTHKSTNQQSHNPTNQQHPSSQSRGRDFSTTTNPFHDSEIQVQPWTCVEFFFECITFDIKRL